MNCSLARSSAIRAALALSAFALLEAAGCGSESLLQPEPEPNVPARLEIVYGTDARILADAVRVDSAWAASGQLSVAVSFAGGCRDHEFRAVTPPSFLEQDPLVLLVYLQHIANDDSCAAHQSRVLGFRAEETEALYRYHHAGTLESYVLRIMAPGDSGIQELDVHYSPIGAPEIPEDREAEQAAIHLSGALTAPEELRRVIRDDLVAIRTAFRAEIRELDEITLVSPLRTDAIDLEVSAPTAQAIAAGTFRAWDALNAEFRVVAIDPGFDQDYRHLTVLFWKNWHTGPIVERYATLDGVTRALRRPAHGLFDDPQDNVCVRIAADRRAYLFRKSWGDCPSGCIENLFWYFTVDPTGELYAGHWNVRAGGLLPSWWEEARRTQAAWFGTTFEPWDGARQVSTGGASPTWAPDGTRIAYAVNTRSTATIWCVDPDGGDPRRIADLSHTIRNLEWSPDGTRFVYEAENDLWTLSSAGGSPTRITTDPASDRHPTWSPDGTRIAFVSTRAGSPDLWIMPAEGGTATRVLGNPQAWEDEPAWSPDGTRLAYRFWYGNNAHSSIWVVSIDGTDPRQITFETDAHFDGTWDGAPAWSPDGTAIAFGSYRRIDSYRFPRLVWVVPAAGGALGRLTFPDGDAPAWSPSGDRLAFVSTRAGASGVWLLSLSRAASRHAQ